MIAPGDTVQRTRLFDAADLADFAALTGTAPGGDVPDALVAGLLSCVLGMDLPGPGTGWLKQTLHHHARARCGEVLTASVSVTRVREDKRLVNLDCRITGDGGRSILTGQALMLLAPV